MVQPATTCRFGCLWYIGGRLQASQWPQTYCIQPHNLGPLSCPAQLSYRPRPRAVSAHSSLSLPVSALAMKVECQLRKRSA